MTEVTSGWKRLYGSLLSKMNVEDEYFLLPSKKKVTKNMCPQRERWRARHSLPCEYIHWTIGWGIRSLDKNSLESKFLVTEKFVSFLSFSKESTLFPRSTNIDAYHHKIPVTWRPLGKSSAKNLRILLIHYIKYSRYVLSKR